MKKLALTLLVTTLTTGALYAPAFAADTVTFNGGHIYQTEQGKPGTIKLDITNVDSMSNVEMDTAELMTYLDADGTIDKTVYTNEVGKGFSIRDIVQVQNAKGGIPVYYASSMPSITAKTPMTAFMSFWKGDDTTKVAFTPKFYLFSDYLKADDKAKVYDTEPESDWLYAPGTAENVAKAGKYLFVVHDNGAIDDSPLNVVCVNVGVGTTATNAIAPTTTTATTPAPTATKVTGWTKTNGLWYYYDNNGAMKTGWLNDGGAWYYLNADGSMATNTTIDGYKLDASGAWIN